MGEHWGRELPGLSDKDLEGRRQQVGSESEKMKIAWRYEGLGKVGRERGACVYFLSSLHSEDVFFGVRADDDIYRFSESESDSWSRRKGTFDFLPYVRPRKTTRAACRNRC
jgi:hypothetical protein